MKMTEKRKSSFPECKPKCVKNFIHSNLLVMLIIIGALFGFVIGIGINSSVQNLKQPDRYTVITLLGFPGELLIRMLKLLILPLISCSLIVGLTSLDSRVTGRVGARAIIYYIGTTCLAALMGLMLVSAIRPGSHMTPPKNDIPRDPVRPLDSFLDIMRNMVPSNIIKACVQQDKTVIEEVREITETREKPYNVTDLPAATIEQLIKDKRIKKNIDGSGNVLYTETMIMKQRTYKIGKGLTTKGSANFLGVIVFSIAVGKIAGSMGNDAATFVRFVTEFSEIITKLVIVVMWYSPVGIMSLIMARFAEMDDIGGTFSSLGLFIVTVVLGVGAHGLLVLPLLFFIITRSNPYKFLKGMTAAMTTAFGTDSSAATLPVTFRCLEENLHIDRRVTRFILPIGSTINMDGTALYEAVSAIFIAQSIDFGLSFGDYIAISFTSILASVGAAAIPHAGLVTMLIVLDTVGLPTSMIAVIFSVDWFLDRFRTMVNVLGDAYGAAIVQHLSQQDLHPNHQTTRTGGGEGGGNDLNHDIGDVIDGEYPVKSETKPESSPIFHAVDTDRLLAENSPRLRKGSVSSRGSDIDYRSSYKGSSDKLDYGYSTDKVDMNNTPYTTDIGDDDSSDEVARLTTYL